MKTAFTLIELLVVVTIIVVLLAMLVPAMDKAIYQAELGMCGGNLHGIATGALTYTVDQRRQYPYRRSVLAESENDGNFFLRLAKLLTNPDGFGPGGAVYTGSNTANAAADDRPMLAPYMDMKLMSDPLSQKIDLASPPPWVYVAACYDLRFGWQFTGERKMSKLGSRWTFKGESFNILASDRDRCEPNNGNFTTHPDRKNYLVSQWDPEGASGFALSRYSAPVYPITTLDRGDLDMNFAYQDGSVRRFNDVGVIDPNDSQNDDGFTGVPTYGHVDTTAAGWNTTPKE